MWDRGGMIEMPEKIDWHHNPIHDRVWLFALNEFEWFRPVMIAYVLTNDEKYAKAYARLMTSFLDQVSMPKWKNERDPVWRLIGAGLRMCESWADAFYVFLPSKTVSADLKIRILGSISDHAKFLSHFRSPHWNHLIQETYGLLRVAAMFPEFKLADDWIKVGVERLNRALSKDVYPDGGYNEGSTFYHRYVVRLLQFIVDFAEDWEIELTGNIHSKLEKMYEFLLYTSRPDGTMPEMNDGFHTWKLRHLLHDPATKFARDDFEYFSTNGISGQRPARVSTEFPYSGIYVMRSDWTEDAKYCILDGGLFGSAHGHEDKLNFEIYAYGSPFIIEAGTYTYVYNNWHKYFESSFSHNTIVVDGKGQLRLPQKSNWFSDPHVKLANKWVSTKDFDYFESTYDDGYGNKKERVSHDVSHTRRVLFIKPDYWILWDVLTGKGEHRFEQLFHFAPIQIEILADRKAILAQSKSNGNLLLHPLYSEGLSIQQFVGSENPIQGWVSPKYGEKIPSPAIIYSRTQNAPAGFVQLLLPFQNDFKIESIEVSEIPVRLQGKNLPEATSIAIKISSEDWTDYLMLAPNTKGTKEFDQYESGKDLFFIRENGEGEVRRKFDGFLNNQENHIVESATLVNSQQ
jgi:hypothetical protein